MPTVEEQEKPKRKKPEYQKIPIDTKLGAPGEIEAFLKDRIIPKLSDMNAVGCIVLIPTHRGPTKYAAIGNTQVDDGAIGTLAYLANLKNEIE